MKLHLISETVAFKNPYYQILDRLYKLPNGAEHHFFVRDEVDTCCVLARTRDGKYLAVDQFRVGPGEILTELPAGRLESHDNSTRERMEIELREETGYEGNLKQVASLPASPYTNRKVHVFIADNCVKVCEQKLDETEFIEVQLLSEEEMKKVLMEGKSSSCGAGLLAWSHLHYK